MKPVKPAILPEANQPEGASVQNSKNRFAAGICVLLALAVFAVFGQTVRYEFVNFDDDVYFSSNYHVKAGLTWNGAQWAFRTGHANNWHPLTWLSVMLDAQLFGAGPMGPHLTNVLLHAANAGLLFLLLRRMMRLRSEASSPQVGLRSDKSVGATATEGGMLWPSAFVAAIFAIHPLHVESVAWVAERKDVLSGLFFMLTLLMYARYAQNSAKNQVSGVRWLGSCNYWLAVLFFALGLMSKPMLVTLPFVMLLLDYWPLNRFALSTFNSDESRAGLQPSTFRRLIWEKIPFFGLSAASCVATVLAQREAIKFMIRLPFTLRFGNALVSYVTYIGQTIWPDNLVVFYPYRIDIPIWQTAGAGGLLLFITLLAIRTARRFPYFTTGWLWYLGMLVPVIGSVQVGGQSHADRYMYLPQIGLSLVMVWAIRDWTASWRWRRQVLGVGALSVIAALMACAWKQTSYWRNDDSLWGHTFAYTSGNYIAHNSLGIMLSKQGRLDEAIEHFQKALKICPGFLDCHNNLGVALLQKGQVDEAIEHFQKVLEIEPNDLDAHCNLGNALRAVGRIDEAIVHFKKALEIEPDDADTYYNLGVALVCIGRSDEARGCFQKVIEFEPDNVGAYNNLGLVLFTQGKFAEASKAYQRTLKLKPNYADAHFMLGCALRSQRKFEAAMVQFQEVLKLEPGHEMAQNGLAWLLATCPEASLRDGGRAVELARQAEQLSGGKQAEILDTLAAAYAEAGRYPEAVETAKRALNLTATQNNQPLAEAIESRLKLYEAGSPYHEKP